jgi:hypothetical protein
MKGISDLLDSDLEESAPLIDENSILSSASDATNTPTTQSTQVTKGKTRKRVTMPPKAKAKPQAKKAPVKRTAGVKRKAGDEPADQASNEHLDATLDTVEKEDNPPAQKPKKRSRTTAKSKITQKEPETQETEDDLVDGGKDSVQVRSSHAVIKAAKSAPRIASKANIRTKSRTSQPSHEVVSEPQVADAEEEEEAPPDSPAKPTTYTRDSSRARQDAPFRRRAGSASDTDRGDPNLRRKLGDITRKYENVDLKYRSLKEVGINEANANMEKLRKQCDATVQASNELIASLKKELASQAPLVQEARKLRKQMQNQDLDIERMRTTTAELSSSLAASQNEIKALQAKLVAARSSSVDNAKTPAGRQGSAQRALIASNAEAAKLMEMKLSLYSDLTGLDILNVKQTEEGDTFDCLQSGQNGSKCSSGTRCEIETNQSSAAFPTLFGPRDCEYHEP